MTVTARFLVVMALAASMATVRSVRGEDIEAPKFGVKATIPDAWTIVARERNETVFVAMIPQGDPDRPGIAACELALAPESLEEYRTRIDANDRRGERAGSLVRNEIVHTDQGDRLVSEWEFRPEPEVIWREVKVRVVAHRQLYTFVFNVNADTYRKAKPAFDKLVDGATFSQPNTGSDQIDEKANRWVQREFKFAIDLPEAWRPALAPDEIALFYANGPAHGIWADNVLVIAQEHRKLDLEALARDLPDRLRAVEPGCEVLSCKVIQQGTTPALETVVRTQRGPFSMTILERRFSGDRFDYETKYTVESERFEELAPTLRKSLDSFQEVPGDLTGGVGKPA